jgi:hypothetical protein
MRDRLRWLIARQLDRLPGQCWADLASWAAWPARGFRERWLPWSPTRPSCIKPGDARCYCGKLAATRTEVSR